MGKLTIVLRHGFAGESVAVEVDEQPVLVRDGVRTRLQIDRADAREVALAEPTRKVRVVVRVAGASATLDVDPAKTPAVTVDWREGRVELAAGAVPHDA